MQLVSSLRKLNCLKLTLSNRTFLKTIHNTHNAQSERESEDALLLAYSKIKENTIERSKQTTILHTQTFTDKQSVLFTFAVI